MNPSDSSTVAGQAPADTVSRIRSAFADRFVPLALQGLPKMMLPSGDQFCFKAFAGEGPEEQRLEGVSDRYSAMSVLGIVRQQELGRSCDVPLDALVDRLDSWAHGDLDLGDAGLVLWIHVLRGDPRAEKLAQRMVARRDDLFAPGYGSSMELGCLVAGLSLAVGAGIGGDSLKTLLADAAQRLEDNRCAETGLFSFGRKVFRKNLHRARVDARLGIDTVRAAVPGDEPVLWGADYEVVSDRRILRELEDRPKPRAAETPTAPAIGTASEARTAWTRAGSARCRSSPRRAARSSRA